MAWESLAVGCDIGGSEIKVAVLRGRRILAQNSHPTPIHSSPGDTILGIRSAISGTVKPFLLSSRSTSRPRRPRPLRATLGVALPGFLDRERERPVLLSNLPALNGTPLRRILSRQLGWLVILEADSNAGAFGEAQLGSGQGSQRLLYITLGTGVGAAMVVEGEIVRVSNHTVGQVAHLPLDPSGPRCPCGARGCVESVLGARGIAWRATRAARAGARLPPAVRRSPRELSIAARSGSAAARRLLGEVGTLLGTALAILSNFLSPDRIVVGGGIAQAGDLLLGPADRALRERVHPRIRNSILLAPAKLGPFAGAIGAALLGRNFEE